MWVGFVAVGFPYASETLRFGGKAGHNFASPTHWPDLDQGTNKQHSGAHLQSIRCCLTMYSVTSQVVMCLFSSASLENVLRAARFLQRRPRAARKWCAGAASVPIS